MPLKSSQAVKYLIDGTAVRRLSLRWKHYRAGRRNAWWTAQLAAGRKGSMDVTFGSRFRMRLYFDSVLCRMIYGQWFEWVEREFLASFLRPGDAFVDIGANVGLYTLLAADIVGPAGAVYSFEPCGRTYQRLLENVKLNQYSQVECFRCALSDTSGEAEMCVSEDGFDAWNSLAPSLTIGTKSTHERVSTTTFDSFLAQQKILRPTAFMKIDVER